MPPPSYPENCSTASASTMALNYGMDTPTTPSSARGILTLHIHPTTGGRFSVEIPRHASVDLLKTKISKQLRISKERLTLLHRDTHLKRGTLQENLITDGSKLTLLPLVESGLVSQRQDQTLMQALQNLTETQVDNFLNGKQPLTLALRLGSHMVFVQLQLAGTPGQHNILNCHKTASPSPPKPAAMPTASSCQSPPVTDNFQRPCPQSQCPLHGKTASCVAPPLAARPPQQYPSNIPPPTLPCGHARSSQPPSPTSPTSPTSPASPASPTWPRSGACIDSVHQHSPGVFSGTFSGILSAAVQDGQGRPKKDISTIAHILGDLLHAAPLYKQHIRNKRRQRMMSCNQAHHAPRPTHTNAASATAANSVPTRPQTPPEKKQFIMQENNHTRSKMAHLQEMLRERQARRQARRNTKAPYPRHLHLHRSAPMGSENKERAISDNCYPALKQDFLAV